MLKVTCDDKSVEHNHNTTKDSEGHSHYFKAAENLILSLSFIGRHMGKR